MLNKVITFIEKVLEILDPFLIMVFSALHLTNIIPTFQTWEAIALGALGVISLIAGAYVNIFGRTIEGQVRV
jgi:hypothetical protein